MSPWVTLATARRVLEQLRGDRRTLALLLLVPCVLMTLLRLVYDGQPAVFDRIGPQLLGYALAFGVAALAQAALASALALGVLGPDVAGPVTLVLLVAVANALLGMALGLS